MKVNNLHYQCFIAPTTYISIEITVTRMTHKTIIQNVACRSLIK